MPRRLISRVPARLGWLAAGLLGLPVLHAAEPQGQALPRTLTEDAAVAWATQHNERILDARSRVKERRGKRVESRRWLPSSPRVGVGANLRNAVGRGNLEATVNLRQEFWFGGKRALTMRIARAELRSARHSLKRAQVQVAADTRHDFYQLIAERQAVAELETIVHRLRGVVRALRELPGGSEEHRIAINQARIAQSRAQAKLAGARRRQESARLALLDILAVSPPQPSQIQGSIPNRPLAIPGRETLLARSVHRRQDLQAAEQSVDAVHQQRRLVGRKVIPDPTVSMQYRTEEGDRIGGLGVSVGLPSFAAIRGSRRQANARLEQAQRRQDTLRRQVRRQVLQGIADYRAARRQLAALSPRVQERARINLRLVEEAARQGQLQPGRIGSVLESLLSLRTARQQALQDLIRAAVDLEKASGGLVVMGRYRAPGQKEPAAETTPAQARSPGP